MKKQAMIVAITVAITTMIVIVGFILLMPVIGPRYLHPLMSQSMPQHMNSAAPSDLDTSTERLTDNGLYRISFTSELNPISINQMHTWTLHVETADGQAVEDAVILVDGGMPQHGHGLPTSPQVTQYLGNGDYLVEGLKFQMGGWWEVRFNISANGQSDNVTFNLILEG
jgi:hypothetical protein